MKIKTKYLFILALVLLAMHTNPNRLTHQTEILDGLHKLHYPPEPAFLEACNFHDYWLFSFSDYLGWPVSVGLFGNVHVVYNCLENAFLDDHSRSVQLRGRGDPGALSYPY